MAQATRIQMNGKRPKPNPFQFDRFRRDAERRVVAFNTVELLLRRLELLVKHPDRRRDSSLCGLHSDAQISELIAERFQLGG